MSEVRDGEMPEPVDDPEDDLPEDEVVDPAEDEPPAEGEEVDGVVTPPTEPRQPSRPSPAQRERARRQEAERQLQSEREQRARLEGQLQGQQRQQQTPSDRAAEDRQFAESLAMLPPDQAAIAVGNRIEQRVAQQMLSMELRTADRTDLAEFAALRRLEPAAERLSGQVEQLLATERQHGRNPTRETVYNYLIGREARERAAKAGQQQRTQGRARIAAQQTRPSNSRSTAAATLRRQQEGDSEAAIEDRWGDTPL